MPSDEAPATSPATYDDGDIVQQRGAGGKLRRERKHHSTPYDRPTNNHQPRRWISKFVDPAKRLISGGASRFLPSLFSSPDEGPTEVEQETADHNTSCSVDLAAPKSTGEVGTSESKGKSKVHFSEDRHDQKEDHVNGQIPDIEQLIKRKTFSREEIDHLMEILHSRAINAEHDRQPPSTSEPEKTERAETSHGKQNALIDKEEEVDKFKWTITTPLPRSTAQDQIAASPVDIARAYMGSRTSEVGFTSTGLNPKGEKLSLSSEFSSKPFMPSPLPKAPICWPGAITQDQQGYSTPQSQKSKYGLQSFSRTPYARTMFTKSKSKLTPFRGDCEKFPDISSTPFQPMRTPMYGKSITNVAGDSYGSGGPIRRTRNKFTSATPASTAHRSPWAKESDSGFLLKKNIEPGASSTPFIKSVNSKPQNSEGGVPSVHPHSSKLARQILEQLDRPITLKEKSEELRLGASWKNSSQGVSASPYESIKSPGNAGLGASKSMGMDALKFSAQTNGENNVLPLVRTSAVSSAGKGVAPASTEFLKKTSGVSCGDVGASTSIQKFDSQTKSPDQAVSNNLPKRNDHPWLIDNQSKAADITNSSSASEPQNLPRRPVLASISIDKSGQKASFAPDTSAGFSFPVTKSSSTFAEPPTPSIMPSSSSPPKQSKVSDSPTFNFGNKITIAPPVVPPVVSFPSMSTAFTPNASAPKFKFGSGKTRLSFALVGTDSDSAPNDAAIPKYKFGSGKSGLNFGSIENDALRC